MPIVADIAALALMALAVWRGWRKGLVRSLIGLAQGVVVYLGAWTLGRPLARLFSSSGGEPGIKALAAGFLLAVVLMILLTEIALWFAWRSYQRRMESRPAEHRERAERWDRAGGACFGAVAALLTISILVWMYALLGAAAGPRLPSINGSVCAALSRVVMRPLLYPFARRFASEPETAALAARAISDPATTAASVRRLAENPDVAALSRDRSFGENVLNSDRDAILRNPAYRRIFENPESVDSLRQLGWLRPGQDAEAARGEMADRLAAAGANVRKLRDDPEVQSLLHDPELKRRADAGDLVGLLDDPRVRRLVSRVLAPP